MSSIGCAETSQAYYISNPELQETVKYTTQRLEQRVGRKTMIYAGSLLSAGMGRDFSVNLTGHFLLKGNVKNENLSLVYGWSF